MSKLPKFLPVTMENVNEAHDAMFANWVKKLNIHYTKVSLGEAIAEYTASSQEKFILGGVCGQVLMSLMDTVFTVAVCTSKIPNNGTISQNNSFFRPAIGNSFIVTANVKKFGKSITFGETQITDPYSEKVICHSVSTFSMRS